MDRLAEIRESKSLTLRELAAISGVDPNTINQLELGRREPRPSTLRKLSKALGVSPEELTADPKVEAPSASKDTQEEVSTERRLSMQRVCLKIINIFLAKWEKEVAAAEAGEKELPQNRGLEILLEGLGIREFVRVSRALKVKSPSDTEKKTIEKIKQGIESTVALGQRAFSAPETSGRKQSEELRGELIHLFQESLGA